jgi:hypothetical protein
MAMPNIIEILNEHGGSMELSELIDYVCRLGIDYSSLMSVLFRLKNGGHIKISGETIIAINTHRADQMCKPGVVNEDLSIKRTGHKQVSIQYDQTLFRVEGRSGKLLKRVVVDEGMADLLTAIWKLGIPTTRSCQGANGEMAWIRFEFPKDLNRFLKLVSPPLSINDWKLGRKKIGKMEAIDLSFPPEDIEKIVEELKKR